VFERGLILFFPHVILDFCFLSVKLMEVKVAAGWWQLL
jgi:hypothetical protein